MDDGPTQADEADTETAWHGAPLWSTLYFIAVPAGLALAILLFKLKLPPLVLYGSAALVGVVMVTKALWDPEWLVALFIIYVPLSRQYVVPLAPGVNATNLFALALLGAWVWGALRDGRSILTSLPAMRLVTALLLLSLVSVATSIRSFGLDTFLESTGADFKPWLDQFILYFALANVIRGGQAARRAVVYLMLGTLVCIALGTQEWLDKRDLGSIERSRVMGPQLQPNDFGAFLVTGASPLLALLLNQAASLRVWLIAAPFLLVLSRVLLATFSRGAYIAMGLAGVAATWIRGKLLVVAMGIAVFLTFAAMPELIPESLRARMTQTTSGDEELDTSSQTRVVLWKAALVMIRESPVLGKGFGAFPFLKNQYTEIDVEEGDNHNMYLFVGSQMGLPAVAVLLALLVRGFLLGRRLFHKGRDPFCRTIGLGGAAMAAGVAGVNLFGSRLIGIETTAYFWIYLGIMGHLAVELDSGTAVAEREGEAAA
jgi:putative inorganic carbon (HCO3(-)) transporter